MLGAKIKLYAAIGWGLLILFALFGALMGKPAAPYVLIIGATIWVAMRMLAEAQEAIFLLRTISALEKAAKEQSKDDDFKPLT